MFGEFVFGLFALPRVERVHFKIAPTSRPLFVSLGKEGAHEGPGQGPTWEDVDHLLAPSDLRNEALDYVGRAKPTPALRRKRQDGGRPFLTGLYQLQGFVDITIQLGTGSSDGLACLLRRGSLKHPVE